MIPPQDTPMDGVIVVDKPGGCTSHDVVLAIRRLLKVRKAGHFGTLDPDATGVLLVAVGRAVRFFPYFAKQDKSYEGRIRLGIATDTYDASGRPLLPQISSFPSEAELRTAMRTLEGEIYQLPPPFSAKKIGGKPMYELARAKKEFDRKPSRVFVRNFLLRKFAPPVVEFESVCSSGTYIRSLAHDLGVALGCGAHLESLRRTAAGPYQIQEAITLHQIEEAVGKGRPAVELMRPLEALLQDLPRIVLTPGDEIRARNGHPLSAEPYSGNPEGRDILVTGVPIRLFDTSGRFLALAEYSPEQNQLSPVLVVP